MHRKKTKLVGRTERLTRRIGGGAPLVRTAKKIEFRGIITTYKVHDRLLGNKRARSHFDDAPPELDDVQRRVLDDLERDDYVVVPFADLVSQETLGTIQADGDAWARQAASDDSRDATKDYLIRRYAQGDEVAPASPWLSACLSSRLLDLANTYLQMWAKLEYVDFWYSVPIEATSDRMLSQRWHRDFDDKHLLKAFLYLVDVDADTGPFEFVAGSARGRTAADFYPWYPGSPAYPPDREFDAAVDAKDIQTFVAPAGTLLLCNTSGFHRGGFATAKPRVLATATYCSPASLASLTQRNYRPSKGADKTLSPAQRYAVS
jgi:hypothetical protein